MSIFVIFYSCSAEWRTYRKLWFSSRERAETFLRDKEGDGLERERDGTLRKDEVKRFVDFILDGKENKKDESEALMSAWYSVKEFIVPEDTKGSVFIIEDALQLGKERVNVDYAFTSFEAAKGYLFKSIGGLKQTGENCWEVSIDDGWGEMIPYRYEITGLKPAQP